MKPTAKTQGAVISCNVSYKEPIDAQTLVNILAGNTKVDAKWLPHINTFFNELPFDSIRGVSKENNISLQKMASVYFSLPSVIQGKNFRLLLNEVE
jgi:hypothetical protein